MPNLGGEKCYRSHLLGEPFQQPLISQVPYFSLNFQLGHIFAKMFTHHFFHREILERESGPNELIESWRFLRSGLWFSQMHRYDCMYILVIAGSIMYTIVCNILNSTIFPCKLITLISFHYTVWFMVYIYIYVYTYIDKDIIIPNQSINLWGTDGVFDYINPGIDHAIPSYCRTAPWTIRPPYAVWCPSTNTGCLTSRSTGWLGTRGTAWRIIPVTKWLVTPVYKPFRPFGRWTTLLRGLTNHGY